ncbi:Endonuclease/exonuclease/phosphatase [Hyella patelloides LEGE 07179]|uniref:Endonuclease/exonuclease/phosphatase n=1 Tax=Hyella patelloides LEGE 07179 TaxID=945734 RepID=A0A563VSU5_9CYAN|nr:endonuclease/exonuclease/phosphatase family protein [Hyella patelloides]VEP14457.1 Endonuclease/exonuclease/phosphatase [Hyella patelloides LEGE 07179]
MKLFNRLIIYFFGLFSIVTFFLSIAGYLGDWNRYLEVTANFKLQYLLLSFCTFFFWLLTCRYYWLCLSLICLILNLAIIAPWYFEVQQQVIDTNYEPLRVLAFNVLHQNERYNDAIKFTQDRKVDIAIFLEATPPWDAKLLALQETFPYHFSAKKLQIEIYSKFPLKDTEIQLYGTYRGLVISQVTVGKSDFVFVATHAYPQFYYGQEGWQIRNEQLEKGIGNQLGKLDKPVIIAGDINITMWSPQYKSMIANSNLKNARQGFGILPTQSIYFPQTSWLAIPLDHFLVSQEVLVTNMETGKNIGSDHLPILLDVLIPNQTR